MCLRTMAAHIIGHRLQCRNSPGSSQPRIRRRNCTRKSGGSVLFCSCVVEVHGLLDDGGGSRRRFSLGARGHATNAFLGENLGPRRPTLRKSKECRLQGLTTYPERSNSCPNWHQGDPCLRRRHSPRLAKPALRTHVFGLVAIARTGRIVRPAGDGCLCPACRRVWCRVTRPEPPPSRSSC